MGRRSTGKEALFLLFVFLSLTIASPAFAGMYPPAILAGGGHSINLGPRSSALAGSAAMGLVYLSVFDPDGKADINAVTVTLPGDLEIYPLFDDGSNGDWWTNDGIYMWMPVEEIPMGDYEFLVSDKSGATATKSILLEENVLAPPLLINPANGSVIETTTPTLEWSWEHDPLRNVDHMVFIWDGEPNLAHFGENLVWMCGELNEEVISVPEGLLREGKSYNWAVFCTYDENYEAIAHSMELSSFSISGSTAPTAPLRTAPPYAPFAAGEFLDPSAPPTFYWVGNNNNVFSVDFSLNPGFAPVAWRSYEDGKMIISDTHYALPMALWNKAPRNVPIYWRVRGAKTGGGGIDGPYTSDIGSFVKGFPHPGSLAQLAEIGGDGDDGYYLGGTHVHNGSPSWTNYRFRAKTLSEDDDCLSLLFRYQDADNYYFFGIEANDPPDIGSIWLGKKVEGVIYWLAYSSCDFEQGVWHNMEVVLNGQNIRAFRNGALIFNINDTSFSSGSIGLGSSWNESFFDDIRVTDLSLNPLFSDNFNDYDMAGWTAVDEPGAFNSPSCWFVSR